MHKKALFILLLSLLYITSLAQNHKDFTQIQSLLDAQVVAWNKGDLTGFMQAYWKSDELKFVGKSGLKTGWQTTLDNYKKSYPDKAAMGTLSFEIISKEKVSNNIILVIGKWHLKRKDDEPQGHFSLVWKKIKGKWVIIADHSS